MRLKEKNKNLIIALKFIYVQLHVYYMLLRTFL